MSLRERLRRLFGREETLPDAGEEAREEAVKAVVRRRCESFRRLLSANKGALEAMSDMEDLLRGTRPFGMGQVRSAATRATAAVYQMVRELRALSRDAWPELPVALTRITGQMEALLNHSGETVQGPLVIPLGDVRMAHAPLVGGKMASLGEVAAHAGLNVPDGFAVTVAAYERFMNHNDLRAELERRIQAADTDNLDEVFRLSSALQQCVLSAPLPPDLEEAIVTAGRHAGPRRRRAFAGPAQQRRGGGRAGHFLCRAVPFRASGAARRSLPGLEGDRGGQICPDGHDVPPAARHPRPCNAHGGGGASHGAGKGRRRGLQP